MQKTNAILIGKNVLSTQGTIIGTILKSVQDAVSGKIISVLLTPSKELDKQNYSLTENGEIIFPFSSLSAVKDIFIIEESVG